MRTSIPFNYAAALVAAIATVILATYRFSGLTDSPEPPSGPLAGADAEHYEFLLDKLATGGKRYDQPAEAQAFYGY